MKHKFKVGDRVCYKKPKLSGNQFPGTVITVYEGGIVKANDDDAGGEIVTCDQNNPDTEVMLLETELERLIRRANSRAQETKKLLDKYQDKIEVSSESAPEWLHPGWLHRDLVKFRIKPLPHNIGLGPECIPKAPTFEPFYIGQSSACSEDTYYTPRWLVTLSDDGKTVTIGCQSFQLIVLKYALQTLMEHGGETYLGDFHLKATRDGIFTQTHVFFRWADVEKIMAALRKVSK